MCTHRFSARNSLPINPSTATSRPCSRDSRQAAARGYWSLSAGATCLSRRRPSGTGRAAARSGRASVRGRPSSSGASVAGPRASSRRASRTMWRRNESAVISNATHVLVELDPPRTRSTVRTKRLCCVSVGVKAGSRACRRAAPRVRRSARRGRAAAGCQSERARLERRRARAVARRGTDTTASRASKRALNVSGASSAATTAEVEPAAAPFSAAAARSGGGPPSSVDRDDVRERVHAGVGAACDGEARPTRRVETVERTPHLALDRALARLRAPSRGTRCRRTRSLASDARQALLTSFVRSAFCSSHLASRQLHSTCVGRAPLPAAARAAGDGRSDRRLALDARADLLGRDRHPQAALRVRRRARDVDRRRRSRWRSPRASRTPAS